MIITAASLRRISAMPAEAMVEALLFLAEQLEAQERKRAQAATRQSRYRNAHGNADVTQTSRESNADVTHLAHVVDNISKPSLLVEESKKDSPPSPSKPLSSDPEGFAEFWAVYPKRAGSADRKPATKAFVAALKRAPLAAIVTGAQAYGVHCSAAGKFGTEFVKQARTWLNADGWSETYELNRGGQSNDFDSARELVRRIGRA